MPSGGGGAMSIVYENMNINFYVDNTTVWGYNLTTNSIPLPSDCDLYCFYIKRAINATQYIYYILKLPNVFWGKQHDDIYFSYTNYGSASIYVTSGCIQQNTQDSNYYFFSVNVMYKIGLDTPSSLVTRITNYNEYTILGIRCFKYN